MERSGWDDDERGAVPPPSQRAWRHPSELGNHGYMAAPPRRASRGQFALAVAAGAVGSLAIATLAVVVTGSQLRTTSAGIDRSDIAGGSSLSVVRTTVLPTMATEPVDATASAETTTPVELVSTTVPVSVPPVISLHRASDAGPGGGDADLEVAAVVVDATTLLAEPDDLAGISRFEAALPDGSTVSVTVDGIDPSSGLARLRTRGSLAVTGADSGTWLGVRCSDDPVDAAPGDGGAAVTGSANPTTTGPEATATPGPTGRSATTVAPTSAAEAASTTATAAAPPVAGTVGLVHPGTTRAPAGAAATTALTLGIGATTSTSPARASSTSTVARLPEPATTSVAEAATPARPVVVSAPSASSNTSAAAAAAATPAGRVVHVRDVVKGSPAALAGLQAGDLIISIDGRPVRSMWSLVLAVRRHAIGETVTVEIRRDGGAVLLPVMLGHHPGTGT